MTSTIAPMLLEAFCEELESRLDTPVSKGTLYFQSEGMPDLVQLLATTPWWLRTFSVGAKTYVTTLIEQGAQSTWKTRAKLSRPLTTQETLLMRFAQCLAKLKSELPMQTKIVIGLPIPDEYASTFLELKEGEENIITAQIALLVCHLPILELGLIDLSYKKLFPSGQYINDANHLCIDYLALNNCLNEVCNGLDISTEQWNRYFLFSKKAVQELYVRWLKL